MPLTDEQQAIIDHVSANSGLTMVSAVAGAGKTTLLVELANTLQPSSGLYLCYNKSIATEAQRKFPKAVHCCTTHSLAYQPTVIGHKLKLGTFTYRQIHEKGYQYEDRCLLVELIREFCLSRHLTFEAFAEAEDLQDYTAAANRYLAAMQSAEIECSHDFYLKYFHLLLADGSLEYPPFDLIMLDEAGDLNEVTLEIFKLLPSTRKIMVGDTHQNIYAFNHTINCFSVMQGQGTLLPMSQSFRVANHIAERIETFCRTYLQEDMHFKGITLHDTTIKSRAFISRTNASLIGKMFELNSLGVPYGLTRKASQIFSLALLVCGLRHRGFITHPDYKHLQEDVNEYFDHKDLQLEHKSLYAYLLRTHSEDTQLTNTIKLVIRYGRSAILACYEEAKRHEKTSQTYMLGTCHSMKGLEADEVTLADDMNEAITDIVTLRQLQPNAPLTQDHISELNLYYVATSRARKSLINAKYL